MDLNLIQLLLQNCKIRPDRLLVVGVSGGADSLCLLDILIRLNYPILAAHFNHQIRPEADQDEKYCMVFTERRNIQFVVGRGNVQKIAEDDSLSLEEAARKLRYSFLFDQARQSRAQAVLVGHHAGDQVETVLMHFLRGSGVAGLRGMQYRTILPEWDLDIPLVRPLLGINREEIDRYCQEQGLEPRQDQSNFDMRYFRNRLRHELIPQLQTYNPNFQNGLLHQAEVLAGEESLLEGLTLEAWQKTCRQLNPDVTKIFPGLFLELSRPLQRRVLRFAVSRILPDLRDLSFEVVERSLDFLNAQRYGQVDVVDGVTINIDIDHWFLLNRGGSVPLTEFPQIAEDQKIDLPTTGQVELGWGWCVCSEIVKGPLPSFNESQTKIYLDADLWKGEVVIRRWRWGEQFQPFGMAGKSVKISNYFTDQHTPRRARQGWPVVAVGDRIIWVVGKRSAEIGRIFPETRQIICLELLQR